MCLNNCEVARAMALTREELASMVKEAILLILDDFGLSLLILTGPSFSRGDVTIGLKLH